MIDDLFPPGFREAWDRLDENGRFKTPVEPESAGIPEPVAAGPPPVSEAATSGRRRGGADRFAVLNAFVDLTAAQLCRADLLVWLVLYRDERNQSSRTSRSDIVRRTGLGHRTVARAVQRLVKLGLLKIIYQGGLGRGVSIYRVWPVLPKRG